jgi:uroporphyrin-III C-methyltransferase
MDQPDSNEPTEARKARGPRLLAALWIVLAIALATGFWLDVRNRIDATQEEVARRLRDVEAETRSTRIAAREAQETSREMRTKLSALEQRLTESQGQQLALEALYQELSRNRDEWQLAEIEQVLAIAQQQLQLSGNVRAALLALQLAEGRLARADRAQFLPVRRALARDIERLRAVQPLDLSGVSLKIDSLIAAVDSLPLAFDERTPKLADERGAPVATDKEGKTAPVEDRFLVRFGSEVWRELRQLVVVRKVETPEPPLLPPTQAYFVRENLKLRLLNARLAVLTRDEAGYREDLRVSQGWIRRYFDTRSKSAQGVLAQMRQLASASISFEPPSIAESIEAVRGYKSRRERGAG